MPFCNKLTELRKAEHLSQEMVARQINMSVRQYQNLEYGKNTPKLENLIALADFFDVSLDELVGREYPKSPTNKI